MVVIMQIIDLLKIEEKEKYLNKLKECDWVAGRYLADLIINNSLVKLCGEYSHVFMLVENDEIISFCTYVFQDDIRDETMYPWIGFVYTYPKYRGNHYFGVLLKHIINKANGENYHKIYVSTNEVGLYEKYGFIYYKNMLDITGNDSRIYYLKI